MIKNKRYTDAKTGEVYKISYHQLVRWQAIDVLGGVCAVPGCECTDKRCLQLDHKNGDGYLEPTRQHRCGTRRNVINKRMKNGTLFEKFQVLCANHHNIKSFDNNEMDGAPSRSAKKKNKKKTKKRSKSS